MPTKDPGSVRMTKGRRMTEGGWPDTTREDCEKQTSTSAIGELALLKHEAMNDVPGQLILFRSVSMASALSVVKPLMRRRETSRRLV
ncbi:hypothetical protein IG631_22304 [Alternaria alternata]|nr:hypothetical protein IG631_22304 [Alternaria alternata]